MARETAAKARTEDMPGGIAVLRRNQPLHKPRGKRYAYGQPLPGPRGAPSKSRANNGGAAARRGSNWRKYPCGSDAPLMCDGGTYEGPHTNMWTLCGGSHIRNPVCGFAHASLCGVVTYKSQGLMSEAGLCTVRVDGETPPGNKNMGARQPALPPNNLSNIHRLPKYRMGYSLTIEMGYFGHYHI